MQLCMILAARTTYLYLPNVSLAFSDCSKAQIILEHF